jgi:hypothetical protein
MADASYNVQMKDADVYMKESMDKYLNNDNFGGWFAEYNAVSIVQLLANKDVIEAKEAKAVLLSKEDIERFKLITAELSTALYQQRSSNRELEQFEKNNYDNYISWYGIQTADQKKNAMVQKNNIVKNRYKAAKEAYDRELNEIKKTAYRRSNAYMGLRGEAFAASNEDPVVLINKVLADVNEAYPEYSYPASDMNEQMKHLYGNYNTDVKYLNSVHSLLSDLSDNLLPSIEKKMHHKERQQEIQEYYHQQYEQQIFIVKILIFFALLAIIGSLLLHYQIIPMAAFAAYLGIVLSVAFVVLFYYLWDFYLRDHTIFDEYQFDVYSPPSNGKVLDTSFNDNIIYC